MRRAAVELDRVSGRGAVGELSAAARPAAIQLDHATGREMTP